MSESFLEKDLEEIIFTTNQALLYERGLQCLYYHRIFRQFKIGNYGIADILTIDYDGYLRIKVYELKNKTLGAAAFWQLLRYIRGLKHFARKLGVKYHKIIIEGVMIGRQIDASGEFCYLPYLNSNIEYYTYDYRFDGIYFEKFYGYNLRDPGTISFDQFNNDGLFDFYKEMIQISKATE